MTRLWSSVLAALAAVGACCYLWQLESGLGLTGMSRDVSWGLYIGQFTFADGLAASAVILVGLRSGKLALYGHLLAIAGTIATMLFVVADLGRPSLVLNVLLYPSPRSAMFWDVLSLGGFLLLNAVAAAVMLRSKHREMAAPAWIRPLSLASIPWAIAMQTVSAFLFCELPGRPLWHTAVLAPRFLASACASGAAVLLLLGVRSLGRLMRYAIGVNLFFVLIEVLTGATGPWFMASIVLSIVSLALAPKPAMASFAAIASVWIDKGFALVPGGFAPSDYVPTAPEILIAAGIWAAGALIAALLVRMANTDLIPGGALYDA